MKSSRNALLVRILRVMHLLQQREWSVPQLARELDAHQRTVYRDLAAMQEAHLPITRDAQARYRMSR